MVADFSDDVLMCGSEDGEVFLWNYENDYMPNINPMFTNFKRDRNASVEKFTPFQDNHIPTVTLFIPAHVLNDTINKKYRLFWEKKMVRYGMVILGFNGELKVYHSSIPF